MDDDRRFGGRDPHRGGAHGVARHPLPIRRPTGGGTTGVARTLGSEPKNATRWSTRGMAEAAGLSQTAVSRIGRAFGPEPRLHETTLSGV